MSHTDKFTEIPGCPAVDKVDWVQRRVPITSHMGETIRSFSDWEKYALPPGRRALHWKEGRSACELGRAWTAAGEPRTPLALHQLLESHEGTRDTVISSGITEHETSLPFSSRGGTLS